MGTGWRRAFCTTIPRDSDSTSISDKQHQASPSPTTKTSCAKLGFLSGGSNPTTPRLHSQSAASSPSLRCRTASTNADHHSSSTNETPVLRCKTTPKSAKFSNPTSPGSPLKLSLFKNSFKFRSSCGICLNSVKTGQGTAIYTAECSHAFHFPCIASHVRKNGSLVCPVCNSTWKDVPLLAIHKNLHNPDTENDTVDNPTTTSATKLKVEEKNVVVIESSPRLQQPVTPKKIYDSRSYDDDEPLLSPTAGGRFITIPEADNENVEEEEEDDVDEFQGFFVNPTPSSSVKLDDTNNISRNVQVRLLPEAAVVSAGRGYETYAVALRVKAPPPPQQSSPRSHTNTASLLDRSHRAPIDLVTVLDVSGSMTGAKLQMLKRAMRLVISSLGSADRLSVVAFCSVPKRLLPLQRMTAQGQRAARRIVDRLVCGQGSSLGDALRKATKVLEDRRERNPVASIMLLSDGQDEPVQTNTANQRHGSSHMSSTRFAHIEIPVHSFGFGQSGGYSNEPAEDAFAKCVGGLLSVVVQDLRVQLGFSSGSAPAEILAVYTSNSRPTVLSSGSIRLGDLYAEEERELLVELRVPSSAVGTHHVMSVRCLYKDPASQEVVYGRDQALLVPRPHAVRSSAPKIERLRNHFITTRAIAESRRLVENNDFTSAHHLLASSRALILQSSSALGDEYVRGLEAELAELHWRKQHQMEIQQQQQMMIQRRRGNERDSNTTVVIDENGEPLTPTSAWRAAEKLAKVAMMKKSLNKVSDLHGFENARF
ncbi:E3 ubiquitin-protein ligase WAV3 [Mercurialis annua]|uniref:E3 ubiquitin-protein ligase WAV3 n=1 Tax=Mercurialis annua TaxID=3986 RepID=UPI00215E3CAB|nr:E3 ubiquitin-protein ligase WAV3 [Mercurialis annua]